MASMTVQRPEKFRIGKVFGDTFSVIGRNLGLWIGLAALFSALPTLILQFLILQPMLGAALTDPNVAMTDPSMVWKTLRSAWSRGSDLPCAVGAAAVVADPGNHRGPERQAASMGDCIGTAVSVLLPAIGMCAARRHRRRHRLHPAHRAGHHPVASLVRRGAGAGAGAAGRVRQHGPQRRPDEGQPLGAARPLRHPHHRRDRHTVGGRHRRARGRERSWASCCRRWSRAWCRWWSRLPPRSAMSSCARSRKAPASASWRRYSRSRKLDPSIAAPARRRLAPADPGASGLQRPSCRWLTPARLLVYEPRQRSGALF